MSIAPTCLNIPPWKILVILKTLITLVNLVQVCLIEVGTKQDSDPQKQY